MSGLRMRNSFPWPNTLLAKCLFDYNVQLDNWPSTLQRLHLTEAGLLSRRLVYLQPRIVCEVLGTARASKIIGGCWSNQSGQFLQQFHTICQRSLTTSPGSQPFFYATRSKRFCNLPSRQIGS